MMLPPKPNQALCPQLQHCYRCLPSKKRELPEVRSHIFKAHHRANLWKMPNDCIDAPSHSMGWRAVAHHGGLEQGGPPGTGNKRCILCRELNNSPEKPSQSHSCALAFLNPVVDKILLPSKMDFSISPIPTDRHWQLCFLVCFCIICHHSVFLTKLEYSKAETSLYWQRSI